MMKMMSKSGGGGSGSNVSSGQESLISLQKASKNWKSFDWVGKTNQWESTTTQNKEARESSQIARKQLAESTKLFKRSVKNVDTCGTTLSSDQTNENVAATTKAIEAVSKQARLTIKSYQEEIDNLTRRSKATESAFDKMTQSLNDMQDPSGILSSVMDQLNTQQQQINQLTQQVDETSKENISLDIKLQRARQDQQAGVSSSATNNSNKDDKEEIMQLRRDVAEYEVEFRSLKNQDITIRKLEARIIELQQGGEEEFMIKLEDAKQELAETEGRRTAEALEREAAMERKVETLALQLKAEKAGSAATNTHLLEASEGDYEREAAWDAQRGILVDDAERVRVMLHSATRERDDLRLKVLALDSSNEGQRPAPMSGGINVSDLLSERKAYEAEVSELSHTVNALREDISIKDTAMVDENRILQSKIDVLEQKITKLNSELSGTVEQLDAAPSKSLMDSMKRELRILKRLEYNADDPDMPETDPEIVGRNEDQDLESVLIAKLRRIETELVKERNQNTKLSEEAESFREEMKKLEKAKVDVESVVTSLEKDLDQAISSSTSPLKSSQGKTTSRSVPDMAPSDPNALERVLDPDATPTLPPQPISDGSVISDTKRSAEEKMQDDRSVANIIMSQRDRLRARCDVLEAERDSFKTELQTQVDAAESLRSDNTKLFEKMRYLQSYNNTSSNNSSNSRSGAAYSRQNSRDLDLEALEQRYEASVDPFRQFSKGERQRKLKEMTPVERTVFVVAKAMLGTKEMRTFLFFYVLAMHLLVFSTTYHWSHNESGVDCMLMNEQLSHLPPAIPSSPAVVSGGTVHS